MESSRAETQIKASLLQHNFFKRCNNDRECFVGNGFTQEGCEAFVGLYGHQRVGAQFQQLTSCRSRSGSNLKDDCLGLETASLP